MNQGQNNIAKTPALEIITYSLFVILAGWWAIIFFYYNLSLEQMNLYWGASYQAMAIWGGLIGLYISKKWGGFKSVMGRAVILFSVGLLLQSFGQSVFSYYNLVSQVEIPYPSLADVGYFGSMIIYIFGALALSKVSGVLFKWKNVKARLQIIGIPFLALIFSYFFFLQGYDFEGISSLQIFLDFGYPLGEAIYVSIAIYTLLISKDILGGVMRKPLVFVMIALIVQYLAEFNFIYQAYNLTWINGGYGDFIYLLSYTVMALSLVKINSALAAGNE